jgi:hypothetical protein
VLRRHPFPIVIALSVCCAFAACAIYDPSLLLQAADAGSDASTDGGSDAASSDDGGAACAHVEPPPPPTTEDGALDLDFVLAGSRLRAFPTGAVAFSHPGPPTGFDLDGVCTCPGPESCTPIGSQRHCDGEGGTDDTTGGIFTTFETLSPSAFNDDAFNRLVTKGVANILLRVRSYNGGLNDTQVTATIYVSAGLDGIQDGGVPPHPPLDDGTDIWTIDPSSLLGGDTVDGGPSCEDNDNVCVPLYVDTEAYVSNGVLVAHVDFPLTAGVGSDRIVIKVSGGVVTGKLVKGDGGTLNIEEGQIGGRWRTADMLAALSNVRDPFDQTKFLCGDAGTYLNAKQIVCKASDVMASPAEDNTGQPCDALSIAVSFYDVPAHIGAIYAAPSLPTSCVGWTDDCSSVK